jgi:hypothetical protein
MIHPTRAAHEPSKDSPVAMADIIKRMHKAPKIAGFSGLA